MSVCSRCGATFSCAMADPGDGQPCWCTAFPPAVAVPDQADAGASCWCAACLKQHIDAVASSTAVNSSATAPE